MPDCVILSRAYDVMLSDLDGVAYLGKAGVVGAAEGYAGAKANGARVVYITNNSSRTPESVAEHLTELGIPTLTEEVFSSAHSAVRQLASLVAPESPVYVVGGEGIRKALREEGFVVVESADDKPVAVVQGMAETISWAELSEAALAIQAGAIHVATNLDATLPKERGECLGNGSMVAAVVHATGVQPYSSGKPEPALYELAAEKTHAQRPLVLGDRLGTDILGAVRAQYDSVHVLTGVSQARDVMLADPSLRPTYLAIDLTDLNTPYPSTEWIDGKAIVADSTAVVHSGQIDIDDKRIVEPAGELVLSLNQYRALCAAIWRAVDDGIDVSWLPSIVVRRDA